MRVYCADIKKSEKMARILELENIKIFVIKLWKIKANASSSDEFIFLSHVEFKFGYMWT